jgi:hypothetical protein
VTRFALMTYKPEFGYWELNAIYDDEPAARSELTRLHGKCCYDMRLFRVDEIMDARSPYFDRAADKPSA